MKEVCEYLKKCVTYYLATVEGDQPRVRPFGSIEIFEDKLYFLTGRIKDVSKQMEANPKIEITGVGGKGEWIRVEAEAVADDRIEAQTHVLDAYPTLKSVYAPGDGNLVVYYLKNATARFCSVTGEPRIVKF